MQKKVKLCRGRDKQGVTLPLRGPRHTLEASESAELRMELQETALRPSESRVNKIKNLSGPFVVETTPTSPFSRD